MEVSKITKKIIAILLLAALILTPANPKVVAATITKTRTASKYLTRKVDGTAYSISGVVDYEKSEGWATKDFITWFGNVTHNSKECGTDYTLYYGDTRYKVMHLPFVKGQKDFSENKKVKAKSYSFAKLHMDTLAGQYTLCAKE